MAISTNEHQTHPAGKLGFLLSLVSAGLLVVLVLFLLVLILLESRNGDGESIFIKRPNTVAYSFVIAYGSAFVVGVLAAWKCVVGWKHAPRDWGDRTSYYPFLLPAIGLFISTSVIIYVGYCCTRAGLDARQTAYRLPWLRTSNSLSDLSIRASIDDSPTSFQISYRESLSDGTVIEGHLRNRSLSAEMGEALIDEKTDAWGNPIIYRRIDDEGFMFISPGPDGTIDTEDDLASSNKSYLDTSLNFPWAVDW